MAILLFYYPIFYGILEAVGVSLMLNDTMMTTRRRLTTRLLSWC